MVTLKTALLIHYLESKIHHFFHDLIIFISLSFHNSLSTAIKLILTILVGISH
ncbi:MAG: hypothetical protein RLZZ568_1226 [Cyanobacteriota bacterium]|jgi:hypothetical protein